MDFAPGFELGFLDVTDNECHQYVTPAGIGAPDNSHVINACALAQSVLYFAWMNVLTTSDEDVVGSSCHVEMSAVIDVAEISG